MAIKKELGKILSSLTISNYKEIITDSMNLFIEAKKDSRLDSFSEEEEYGITFLEKDFMEEKVDLCRSILIPFKSAKTFFTENSTVFNLLEQETEYKSQLFSLESLLVNKINNNDRNSFFNIFNNQIPFGIIEKKKFNIFTHQKGNKTFNADFQIPICFLGEEYTQIAHKLNKLNKVFNLSNCIESSTKIISLRSEIMGDIVFQEEISSIKKNSNREKQISLYLDFYFKYTDDKEFKEVLKLISDSKFDSLYEINNEFKNYLNNTISQTNKKNIK